MSTKKVLMWVDPEFKKQMKMRAIDEDEDVISLTRKIANKNRDIFGKMKRINDNFFKIL